MAKKKKMAKMAAPRAASSKSSNGLAHNAEESCVMEDHPTFDNEEWNNPPCMDLTPGSPGAALVALDDLATKIQTDVTALCMVLASPDCV